MNVSLIHQTRKLRKPVITIGTFDGVHTGHRYILEHLKERAKQHGGEAVVVTLWPHPRLVLSQDLYGFRLLHTREEKVRELQKCGLDELVIIPFDSEIASLTACEFVQQYLVSRLGVEVLLLGYDNRFGKDRRGDPEGLARCASRNRFRIEKLPEYTSPCGRVNSTTIREYIGKGDLEKASALLGYPYYMSGTVVEGNRIGREIGFPTANIHPLDPYKLIPMNGVYAVRAEMNGRSFGGMLNIGFRPTIDSSSAVKTVEAHLFDVSGDFYKEQVVIHFLKRIRDEMKFSGLEALRQQLEKDRSLIREYLRTQG